jgi:hypothetical protein
MTNHTIEHDEVDTRRDSGASGRSKGGHALALPATQRSGGPC